MAKSPIRQVFVQSVKDLSPNMRRVVLAGDELQGFPADSVGGYLKLRLEDQNGDPLLRTYTVAEYQPDSALLSVDFVMHDDGGFAADWARDAKPGDPIRISGPGPKKPVDLSADWFLIAGDMSALPAIRYHLTTLPRDARGYLVLDVLHKDDAPNLQLPDGMQLKLLVTPAQSDRENALLDAITELEWQDGKPFAWVAGELRSVLPVRKFLLSERGLSRSQIYVSSYWQQGLTEDAHKLAKKKALS